jgi:putative FmdB family regulatory protein
MPHYEFICHECNKVFSRILSLVDYEEGDIRCPNCGSTNVEQCWSAFTALTSRRAPNGSKLESGQLEIGLAAKRSEEHL